MLPASRLVLTGEWHYTPWNFRAAVCSCPPSTRMVRN
jgi:hypothetical protein